MSADFVSSSPGVLSLSQFTQAIGRSINGVPHLTGVWIVAELSDLRFGGGHCYMELIEKNEAGQTVAKVRANMWANIVYSVRKKFFDATGKDIASGMKVLLRGSATHHNLYGLSINIHDIDPSYTLGDMERLRREILARLAKEGVINCNKELEMPVAPQRIAVISAEGAAGYGDFINQLASNQEGFVFYPCLFNAVMQGDRTSLSVRKALAYIESTIDLWDCVAIVRGGGATTDLNGFDDYELARAVATFSLPVVVGIGHERDRTVLDEIAHTRMKTPTAAGAFFVDALRDAYQRATDAVDSIIRYGSERIAGEARRLSSVEAMIPSLAAGCLATAKAALEKEMTRIPMLVASRISAENARLDNILKVTEVVSASALSRGKQRIVELETAIKNSYSNGALRNRLHLTKLEELIEALKPDNILRRGYSVTRVEGKAIKDASQLKSGTVISTQLLNGMITSTVK